MERNVGSMEHGPRLVMALAAAVGAATAPNRVLGGTLLAFAAGMLTTVAISYCPLTALRRRADSGKPQWRTIKTWRVEA